MTNKPPITSANKIAYKTVFAPTSFPATPQEEKDFLFDQYRSARRNLKISKERFKATERALIDFYIANTANTANREED